MASGLLVHFARADLPRSDRGALQSGSDGMTAAMWRISCPVQWFVLGILTIVAPMPVQMWHLSQISSPCSRPSHVQNSQLPERASLPTYSVRWHCEAGPRIIIWSTIGHFEALRILIELIWDFIILQPFHSESPHIVRRGIETSQARRCWSAMALYWCTAKCWLLLQLV